jgi:adenine-specific DNA-methyltransferase
MAGEVQMVYFDPPYGIKYGSNFQPFVNKRDVKDGKDEDLTQEPEMIKAFRDTWELGLHSYLTYLRDRIKLAHEILHESGSIFVQISDENIHHVKEIMDELYGSNNFINIITFQKTGAKTTKTLDTICDYILVYAKNKKLMKYFPLFEDKPPYDKMYSNVELPDGTRRKLTNEEKNDINILPKGARVFRTVSLSSQHYSKTRSVKYVFNGEEFYPPTNRQWSVEVPTGLDNLVKNNRIVKRGDSIECIKYLDDFPVSPVTNMWTDTMGDADIFVVQTTPKVIQRCILMSTSPGDLVLDITCGSGTTAFVAEEWGRRWITCDTSRVAITLAKQRLMTALFDYYELAHPQEGVGSGFRYKAVPRISAKCIANNEPTPQETLYDQPFIDKNKVRVTGPFTMEAVPAPVVKSIDEIAIDTPFIPPEGGMATGLEPATSEFQYDSSISRSGETLRQQEWRDELLKTGIRAKGGKNINFSRIEILPATRWLHADGDSEGRRVVVSFGPEHAPLEQRQVALAIEEAQTLVPKPKLIVFAAFQFDPEAAKDIDETSWPGVTLLKAQMNVDLQTDDLKKKRSSNESFWLIGQPDVRLIKIDKGDDSGKYKVEVNGFDYYNPVNGNVESGGTEKIAMWMLDTDYDGRSLYPHQVFFPMSGEKDGWSRLAKNLKAEIDEDLIEAYRGTVSLPFEAGANKRAAVKIVDDRGIESLKIVEI